MNSKGENSTGYAALNIYIVIFCYEVENLKVKEIFLLDLVS